MSMIISVAVIRKIKLKNIYIYITAHIYQFPLRLVSTCVDAVFRKFGQGIDNTFLKSDIYRKPESSVTYLWNSAAITL